MVIVPMGDFEIVRRIDIDRLVCETLCSGVVRRYSCDPSDTKNGVLIVVCSGESAVSTGCGRIDFGRLQLF